MSDNLGSPDFEADGWSVETMVLDHSRKLIARKWGITYVYSELSDGSWFATKIRGGRVIAEREFGSIPRNIAGLFRSKRRPRRRVT